LQHELPASMLKADDAIIIGPYSIIPCDAYIIQGSSHINEALVTGESMPVFKEVGDLVLAGTRNGGESLTAIVQKEQDQSFLTGLIESVTEASEGKTSIQDRVSKITEHFVVGVMLLAGLWFLLAYIRLSSRLPFLYRINLAGTRAMAILTAACPCALGLSTPSAIMAGIDAAWTRGVLITEGAATMEELDKVTHVVMDKTGTLTQGTLDIAEFHITKAWEQKWKLFCLLVCAAEESTASTQPAAKAVFKKTLEEIVPEWQLFKKHGAVGQGSIANLVHTPGKGVSCDIDAGEGFWHKVSVGSSNKLEDDGVCFPEIIHGNENGGLAVHVGIDGLYAGSILLSVRIHPIAPSAVLTITGHYQTGCARDYSETERSGVEYNTGAP
jgi:P-type Cu+ transporter